MQKIITYGTVSDDGLKIFEREKFTSEIKKLRRAKDKTTNVKITIERNHKTRGLQQNRYYWGVVIDIIAGLLTEAHGEDVTSEEAHELMKSKFNFVEIANESTGEVINLPLSTAKLSTMDFEIFIEKCRNFAYEFFGVQIPLPNEQSNLEL